MENIRNAELEGNARRLRTQPAVTVKEADGQVWDFRYNTVMNGNSEITFTVNNQATSSFGATINSYIYNYISSNIFCFGILYF